MPNGQKYAFGEWLLDPAEHLLLRNGQPIALNPKLFATLLVLVENARHLVPKDEFFKRVWPDTFVEDAALTQNISQLRKVLANGESPVIETVPKRGYRLLLTVRGTADRLPLGDDSSQASDVNYIHPPGVEEVRNSETMPAAPSASPARVQLQFTARSALALGLTVCGLALFSLYHGHSPSSKAAQPSVSLAVTNVGEKYSPSLSPDGQQLAFAWNGGVGAHFSIYEKLVGTEESVRLTNQPSIDFNPVWSPDGRYIAFCRIQRGETGIYIIPALGGAERKVHETRWEEREFYEVFWYFGRLSWSPDGKLLAFSDRASSIEPTSIFLLSLDSLEVRRLTSPQPPGDYNPVFSPDGRTLAFNRGSHGVTSIYTIAVAGGEEERLISGPQYGWGLAWTPDGRDIVFAKAGWLAGAGWLWKISAHGSEPQRLQFGQEGTEPSIRGNQLVYARQLVNLNIWKRKLDSGHSSRPSDRFIASTTMESGPQFSPDGTRIAFESTRSGAYEVWTCRGDGTDLIQLTHFNSVTGTPRWSPDGQQIAFDSRAPGNAEIFVMDYRGGSLRRLTSEPSTNVVPSWSRDGRWIYFASDRAGDWQVWKMRSSGGSAIQVTHHGGYAAFESPDGKFVYFAKGPTVPGLWRIPTNGSQEVEVIGSLDAGYWGYWAVVENGIYYLDAIGKPGISFFNTTTHRTTRLFDLENRPAREAPGLAVSSDGGTILYTQLDALSRDIILVQNFR